MVIENVVVRFEDNEVLKGIALEARPGQVVAIMGSSGGGKTTLLRCVAGLLRPTTGGVSVDGVDVLKDPEGARKRMGMVFQSAALFDYMNVMDNVLFGIERQTRLDQTERAEAARKALERVGLRAEDAVKMPAELSGGMRKRVGIARALALQPQVMLYDEPTTGLDPITTYNIDLLIAGIRDEMQTTSLLVSHDVSSVARVADRVAFLHKGELIFDGLVPDFEQSQHPAIRELIDKSRATKLSHQITEHDRDLNV